MKLPLSLQMDPETPRNRFLVDDADDVFVGAIDEIGVGEWQNSHPTEGKLLSPVPMGPFKTPEAAFEAFKKALT